MDAVRENYYQKHISESQVLVDSMPLVHVCDCFTFRKIFACGAILPTNCKVFNQDLAYYFYGRPSYRVGGSDITSNAMSMFPICFIIDSEQVAAINNAYPFDTGAFKAGIFSRYVHPKADVTDYKLVNSFEFLKKFVGYFYGNNRNYYDGEISISKSNIPAMAFELHSLHQMITSETNEDFDDRCHTVEIQTDQVVDIQSGGVRAMVLPSSIASDPEVSSFLFDNDVQPIVYQTTRCSPSSLTSTIITEVRKFYEQEGVI